jgi:RND superfamily putative drug exporter
VPLALLVLLAVFATAVAALLPVGVGLLAVVGGVAAVMLLSHLTDMAQYTINVVTLIGLGVAIDYSLFIVTRYRDELARGAGARGRAGGGGLHRRSRGRLLGAGGRHRPRRAALLPPLVPLRHGARPARSSSAGGDRGAELPPGAAATLGTGITAASSLRAARRTGVWRAIAHAVMARPVLVLFRRWRFVLVLGAPFARLRMAAADMRVLPRNVEARRGHELLRAELPSEAANRIVVAVRFPDAPALCAPSGSGALRPVAPHRRHADGAQGREHRRSRPSIGRGGYQTLYRLPRGCCRRASGSRCARRSGETTVVLAAISDAPPPATRPAPVVKRHPRRPPVGDGR